MRWPLRARPRCRATVVVRPPAESRPRPTGYADFLGLARRMSIPDDDAIRHLVDASIGLTAGDRTPERR
jgi:hypothetical protein